MRRRRIPDPLPPFIETCCEVRVRFAEMDALGVVWHGHYATYFEEGRVSFGREHGLDYLDFHAAGVVAPIVHLELDYHRPARYGEVVTVRTRLHPEDAARLLFTYSITDSDSRPLTTGLSLQIFTDGDGDILLTRPAFYEEFLTRTLERRRDA